MTFSNAESEVISELNNCTSTGKFLCYIVLFLAKDGMNTPELVLISSHLIQRDLHNWLTQGT